MIIIPHAGGSVSKAKSGCTSEHDEGEGARKHECVLQYYLSGFTRNHDKNSRLYVVDSAREHAFVSTPQSVVAERDFAQIGIDAEDPRFADLSYAQFESELASALARLDRKGDFFGDTDRALILRLIAELVVLNPDRTEMMRQYKQERARRLSELAIANRQGWESQKEKAAAAGIEGAADFTYEKLMNFVERNDETIAAHTTGHLARDLQSVTTLHNLLHRRSWMVARAARGSGGFITSDRPVTLTWDDMEMEAGFYAPGFGLQGTSVFFPLTKDLVMRGRFDGRVGTLALPVTSVAGINSRTVFYAGHQIYAETESFRFLDEHLVMRRGQDLLPMLQRSR
nr:DUF4238 domain-containing protein [Paraburkholderia sp. SG-MS1]